MPPYRESDVPDQTGKTFIVTGANTGIGYDTARVLAASGARVLLGCRSEEKAETRRGYRRLIQLIEANITGCVLGNDGSVSLHGRCVLKQLDVLLLALNLLFLQLDLLLVHVHLLLRRFRLLPLTKYVL